MLGPGRGRNGAKEDDLISHPHPPPPPQETVVHSNPHPNPETGGLGSETPKDEEGGHLCLPLAAGPHHPMS